MKISVILGHPRKGSFNHAIAEQVIQSLESNGHKVFFHDLYEEKFDPILPYEEIPKDAKLEGTVLQYCEELAVSEGLVIIHPNWWGQPPAILKGWVDRIIRPGVAYRFDDDGSGEPVGLLKMHNSVVLNTTDTEQERELKVFGDPLETIWKNCIFSFCGISNFYRNSFGIVVNSSDSQRKKWLGDVRDIINNNFPKKVPFTRLSSF